MFGQLRANFLRGNLRETGGHQNNGRINIPAPLTNYASLNKECVIIGVNERLEIWSNDSFDDFFNNNIDNFDEIAEGLFNE